MNRSTSETEFLMPQQYAFKRYGSDLKHDVIAARLKAALVREQSSCCKRNPTFPVARP